MYFLLERSKKGLSNLVSKGSTVLLSLRILVFNFSQNGLLCNTNKVVSFLLLEAPNSSAFLSQTSFNGKRNILILVKTPKQPHYSVASVFCLSLYYYEKHISYSK